MGSSKSRGNSGRGALEPQRRPGKERVTALMEAAAAVIAERGFDGATMAEIASRAGALVGSLYHFFPNKEVLAEALIERYTEIVNEAFARIDARASSSSIEELADALIELMIEIHEKSKAMRALLEARTELSVKREEFRKATLGRIARTLMIRSPQLSPERAQCMAIVLLLNMKNMKALVTEHGEVPGQGAAAELRDMTRLYLASKIADL